MAEYQIGEPVRIVGPDTLGAVADVRRGADGTEYFVEAIDGSRLWWTEDQLYAAELPKFTMQVEGYDMGKSLGLQCAAILHPDGRREQLMGFVVDEGQSIYDALKACLPPGGSLIIDHDWIEHYTNFEVTGRVCLRCGTTDGFKAVEVEPAKPTPTLHKGNTAFELSTKNQTSSAGRWWGKSVIYGKEDDHATPYMTRYWIGRLRLHVFHRGDQDPDCHDHPWDFWTFPFTPYVEEVVLPDRFDGGYQLVRQVVRAWRWNFRPATHTHRVLGRWSGQWQHDGLYSVPIVGRGPIITLVWRTGEHRKWGFLKHRDGKWCWVHWKSYVFGGGKHAPCE